MKYCEDKNVFSFFLFIWSFGYSVSEAVASVALLSFFFSLSNFLLQYWDSNRQVAASVGHFLFFYIDLRTILDKYYKEKKIYSFMSIDRSSVLKGKLLFYLFVYLICAIITIFTSTTKCNFTISIK